VAVSASNHPKVGPFQVGLDDPGDLEIVFNNQNRALHGCSGLAGDGNDYTTAGALRQEGIWLQD